MATLQRRVQVLFDPERYEQVEAAARARGMSAGAFIREAVDARIESERNDAERILAEMFARADAFAAAHPSPPEEWEDIKAEWEREMDPVYRAARNAAELRR
ncbi:MAG: hypothetical protein QM606_09410 [Leucobacter sp.]